MSKLPETQLTKKEKAAVVGDAIDEVLARELIQLGAGKKKDIRPYSAHSHASRLITHGHSAFKPKYTKAQIEKINEELADFQHKTPEQRMEIVKQANGYTDSVLEEARQTEAALANACGAPRQYIDAILAGEYKKDKGHGK